MAKVKNTFESRGRRPLYEKTVRHIEGALAPVGCVSERYYEKCSCPDESRCAIRSVMRDVREAVVRIMERVTVADLCERWRKLQQEPLNPFDFSI